MFLATIIVCAGIAVTQHCEMNVATKVVFVPGSYSTMQACFKAAQTFAAVSPDVPEGPFIAACGGSYVTMESLPT